MAALKASLSEGDADSQRKPAKAATVKKKSTSKRKASSG